jgi:bifunctional non-homologous end joining protein LigD
VKARPSFSTGLPDFVEPMQAKLVDSTRPGDWIYEIKFDGYRALTLRGGSEMRVMSRNKKDLGKKFPAIAASVAKLDVKYSLFEKALLDLFGILPEIEDRMNNNPV